MVVLKQRLTSLLTKYSTLLNCSASRYGSYGSRTLFTSEALGLDGYEKQRVRTQTQFTGMVDKFRDKMREYTVSDTKQMIFTEDLKNMVHLTESRPEDLTLILQMIKRFNKQNSQLRFGNFVFGPVVMRMYYFLNEPKLALEAFKDPEIEQFFEQVTSCHILFDLLYKNGMYQEILDTYESVQKKQIQGQRFPRNVTILVFAACYKLNTAESYEFMLKLLNDMKEGGIDPVRRCVSFAAGLALNQNAPQVALEIISNTRNSNYVSIRNLKLWALADLDRPDDCLPILRFSVEFDSPSDMRKHSVLADVLEKVSASTQRFGNKEVSLEFDRIHKALVESKQNSQETLSQLLESEIEALTPAQNRGGLGGRAGVDGGFQQRDMMERSFRIGQRIDLKPQRNPSYQGQGGGIRQGLKSDIY